LFTHPYFEEKFLISDLLQRQYQTNSTMSTTLTTVKFPKSDSALVRAPVFDKKVFLQLKQKEEGSNVSSFLFNLLDSSFFTENEKETNEQRIENRMKQIKFGKNTIGYDNYLAAVPK
jgi:hypothetical protein